MHHSKPAQAVGTDLTAGPIMRTLLIFAGPIILSNLLQQLYSVVDLIIIGQFAGSTGTVGVNVGSEITDLLTPVATAFSTAGQIYIAQLFGAKAKEEIQQTIGTLLSFMVMLSLVLSVLTFVFVPQILQIMNCPPEALAQADAYMRITALGLPFIFGYNAICGILRGMGESRHPLQFVLVAAVVNIVLDLLLVVVIPLEAAGTAIATALSQAGAFGAAFRYLWKNKETFAFRMQPAYFRIHTDTLRIFVRLGMPQVCRSMMIRLSMFWLVAEVNAYGMVVSETYSIGEKLRKLMEAFVLGVDTASASMVAQNLGAEKTERAGKVTLNTLLATTICALAASALCLAFPEEIYCIFTRNPAVQSLGTVYLRILTVHILSSAVIGSFQAMITGCGFTELGIVVGILDGVVCKVGLTLLLVHGFGLGYLGMFWGMSASRILPGLFCAAYFFSGHWKTRKRIGAV